MIGVNEMNHQIRLLLLGLQFSFIATAIFFDQRMHLGVSVGDGFRIMTCIAEQVVFWPGLDGDHSADFG